MARRKKILLVEDNNDWRGLLTKFLNRFGYDAIEADSGREALGKAFEIHPDLILMDIYLPDITGDEITARLKANPATQDIPVIITIAFATGPQTKRALDAGAAEILHKPFPLTMLCDVLSKYLSGEDERRITVANVERSNCRSPSGVEKASPQAKVAYE